MACFKVVVKSNKGAINLQIELIWTDRVGNVEHIQPISIHNKINII